jgi:hypothetical protein
VFKGDSHFSDPKYGALLKDPELGPKMILGMISPYRDDLAKRSVLADIAAKEAEAQKAGITIAPQGTNVFRTGDLAGAAGLPQATAQGPGAAPVQAAGAGGVTGVQPVASIPQKPQPGYELDPLKPGSGELRPIPGGAADIKFTENKQKALTAVMGTEDKINDQIAIIDGLLKDKKGGMTGSEGLNKNYGLIAGNTYNFSAPARDAWADLNKLKAQGSLGVLTGLKAAGATLGSVSDAEGALVGNAYGALNPNTSFGHSVKELTNIRATLLRTQGRVRDAYERQYGSGTPGQTPTRSVNQSGPAAGPTVDKGTLTQRVVPSEDGLPPNAQKAPDGNYYVPDPNRPGKYLRVDMGQ